MTALTQPAADHLAQGVDLSPRRHAVLPARHGQTRREVAGLERVGRHSGADRDANSKKCIDDCRIETRAAALEHDLHCSVRLDAVTIRTRAPESIEDVGDRRDPHLEGNLFAAEPLWVAGAVPALVMGQRDRGGEIEHPSPESASNS